MSNKYADQIRDRLSMPDVVNYYGFEINRSGFISCPFHSEDTSSCSVKPKFFHCFGCGTGGDVITFVRKYFNLSFMQAVVKINDDFMLNLDVGRERTPEEIARDKAEARARAKEKARKQAIYKNKVDEYTQKAKLHRQYLYAINELAPKSEFDFVHPLWLEAIHNINALELWLEENLHIERVS